MATQQNIPQEKDEIQTGRFFNKTHHVWGVGYKSYGAENWTTFHRSAPINVNVRRKSSSSSSSINVDPYKETCDGMFEETAVLADFSSTRTDSDKSSAARIAIWPVDISGQTFDRRPHWRKNYQIAHLLPAGAKEHEEWFGVAAAVLGLPESTSTQDKLKATRGYKAPPKDEGTKAEEEEAAKSATPTVTFAEYTRAAEHEKGKRDRKMHTGTVHFVCNKLRMKGQATYFDGIIPSVLLIPCYTLEEAKAWRGEGYKAIVLAGLPRDHLPPNEYELDAEGHEELANTSLIDTGFGTEQFYNRYIEARENGQLPDEKTHADKLEQARGLLEATILGLAQYVKSLEGADLRSLRQDNQEPLKKRSKGLHREAPIPTRLEEPTKPVLFVDFGPQTGGSPRSHPAPDPLLLAAKSGVVWGRMTGFTLLAYAELTGEDENDSLDRLAEETWLAKFRSRPSPPVPKVVSVAY